MRHPFRGFRTRPNVVAFAVFPYSEPDYLVDTQIISYGMARSWNSDPGNIAITSVVAQELLLVQSGRSNGNNYYVPFLWPRELMYRRRTAPRVRPRGPRWAGKAHTDRLVLDFSSDYPSVVEHSHAAIAEALNTRNYQHILQRAHVLGDARFRVVVKRVRYLRQHGVTCEPLTKDSAEIAMDLFAEFVRRNTPKSNVRNTLNDLLSYAVALDNGLILETEDRALAEFMNFYTGAHVEESYGQAVRIKFEGLQRRAAGESKRYINSWQVRASRIATPR